MQKIFQIVYNYFSIMEIKPTVTFRSLNMLRAVSFKRKPAGQTTCRGCGRKFNNAVVPPSCQCGFQLGGNYQPPEIIKNSAKDAKVIRNGLASVRLNPQGANLRIFVNITENKVSNFRALSSC